MIHILLAAALFLAACGGDDDGADSEGANGAGSSSDSPVSQDTTEIELPQGCSFAPFDFEVRFEGEGPRQTISIADAVAIRGFEGGAWTILLSVEPFPEDANFEFGLLRLPEDVLIMQGGVFVSSGRAQEPQDLIMAGDVFESDDDEPRSPVFGVLQGAETPGSSVNRHDRVEVLYAGQDAACLAFEVTSESGVEFAGIAAGKVVVDQ